MGSFRLIEKHLSFQKKQAFRCLLFIWEIWGGKGYVQKQEGSGAFRRGRDRDRDRDRDLGGAFQYSRRGLRLRCRGALGIHRASGPMNAKGCVERLHRFAQGAADWRSGPRWRIISALCPVHPFASSRHFPSRGNEKIGGTGYCVTYDTDSQSRNAPCVPFRGRGPRSGEGMYEGKNDYDTPCGRDRRRRHYKIHCP